jgi:hypothetical protein
MTAVLPARTTDLRVTEPGVYDLGEDDYFGDPIEGGSLSSSGAKLLLPPSCPAKYRYDADHPKPPKRVFDLGHAAHKLVLGKGAELVPIEFKDYKTKKAQEQRDEAHEAGRTPILAHEMEQARGMAAAVRQHPDASALFQVGYGQAERSLFWVDGPSGIWRRARLDWLPDPEPGRRLVIADLKSCVSANPDDVSRAVNNFRYHLQAAWYREGIQALGIDVDPAFVMCFVERDPPHVITCMQPDREALRMGAELARKAINLFKECRDTGEWPGYQTGINFVSLPYYAARQHEEIL